MAFFATSSSLLINMQHTCMCTAACRQLAADHQQHARTPNDGAIRGLSNITCGACAATQMCGWKRAHKRVPPSEDMHVDLEPSSIKKIFDYTTTDWTVNMNSAHGYSHKIPTVRVGNSPCLLLAPPSNNCRIVSKMKGEKRKRINNI